MKVEGILFAGLAVFFGVSAAAYWVLSREPAGTTALVLSGGLGFIFIGYYLLFTSRRIDPEDQRMTSKRTSSAGAGDLRVLRAVQLVAPPGGIQRGGRCTWSRFCHVARGARVLYAVRLSLIGFVFEYYRGVHAH